MKTVVKQTVMNPDVRAADHLRRTRHKGRSLSEQRAARAGHQALAARTLPAGERATGPGYPLYTGAELRPYEGRPGAMDAFDKPSMINGQLRPRRVPMRYTEAGEGGAA